MEIADERKRGRDGVKRKTLADTAALSFITPLPLWFFKVGEMYIISFLKNVI